MAQGATASGGGANAGALTAFGIILIVFGFLAIGGVMGCAARRGAAVA
jgi:hypothetical protein